MRMVYLFVLAVILTTLQTAAGTFGIGLALLPALVFYATYAYGPKYGFPLAVLTGAAVDFCGGWNHPWSISGYLLAAVLASVWLYRVESDSILLLTVPGALLPMIGMLPQNLLAGGFSAENVISSVADAVAGGVLGAVLFPVAIIVFDFFGGRLELGIYGDAKERLRKESV